MFNFTTQTVYNAITENKNLWKVTGKKPALRIGNTRFDAANVIDVQVKKPTPEALASVTFDLSKILPTTDATTPVSARILLYIGLSMNSQDSFYANDFVYKGKPFYLEFVANVGESAETVAARAKANAKKYLLFVAQEKLLDVKTDGGNITISGVNGYQQIKIAKLQKFDPEAITVDCCSNQGDFVDVITGVPVVYTFKDGTVETENKKLDDSGAQVSLADNEVAILPGIEAFGNYNWIIHNLRLPTAANTNFWAVTKEEMPAVNQTYTQIIIRIQAERDGVAGQVVGQRAVSVTNHVLYVAGDYKTAGTPAKTAYDAILALVGTSKIKTDADEALEEPYASTDAASTDAASTDAASTGE